MPHLITRDLIECSLRCKYKSHLKFLGQKGTTSDYEQLLLERRNRVKHVAIQKILASNKHDQVVQNGSLSVESLQQGRLFVLNADLVNETTSLHFDGVMRSIGPSNLGNFHDVPIVFHEQEKINKREKSLLQVFAYFLSQLQDRSPQYGIIWRGEDPRPTRVKINPDVRSVERLVRELMELGRTESTPQLRLNDHCQICEFQERCHQKAIRDDNISLLRGIGEKELTRFSKKGLLTVTQLAHTFRPRRKRKHSSQAAIRHFHALQALAVRDQKIYIFGTPDVPDGPVKIYIDLEGIPEEGFIYLIGMLVVENDTQSKYSFWADNREEEADNFERFLSQLDQYETYVAFCYGRYEKSFFTRMRKLSKRKGLVNRLLTRLNNVLSILYSHIYFPVYTNRLKDVVRYLGFSWTDPSASGLQSIVWRKRWEDASDSELKMRLITYNLEDCEALKTVTEFVQRHAIAAEQKTPSTSGEVPQVSYVQELEKHTDKRRWGAISFFHPDFHFINRCAYFDYQRNNVYVRTSKRLKELKARKRRDRNHSIRVSSHLEIAARVCPFCKSKDVTGHASKKLLGHRGPRTKRGFDLIISGSGIKRRVVECHSTVHLCSACGKAFVPDQHLRLNPHFHALKSWAMYHRMVCRLSCGRISDLLWEFFGFHVNRSQLHQIQSEMAEYYQPTYRKLMKSLLSGNLLHVDETQVKLRTGKGYVWVFASLETVVFMFKPTREGEFLQELLKDFRGVLVSDFFAAYESVECPKQKCLVHLIRDINQDLLSNPFDEELKSVALRFGAILRDIVTAVDKHGLKRSILGKHRPTVTSFFRVLRDQVFRSEAAETFRKRLLKYQNCLFTFIEHDGIPWNNNNAETAIKRFADYRADTVGLLTETGIEEYLVLLSICVTCRYKGLSFLRFLTSKKQDVDSFLARKRSNRSHSKIELYPKGYVHPIHRKKL